MYDHLAYAAYLARHKFFVFMASHVVGLAPDVAFRHDNDKLDPLAWGPYRRQFYNPDGSLATYVQPEPRSFKVAWMRHQQHNNHHWQAWLTVRDAPCDCPVMPSVRLRATNLLVWDRGELECLDCGTTHPHGELARYLHPLTMPGACVLEMVADWIGAAWAIGGDPGAVAPWYARASRRILLAPATRTTTEATLVAALAAMVERGWTTPAMASDRAFAAVFAGR